MGVKISPLGIILTLHSIPLVGDFPFLFIAIQLAEGVIETWAINGQYDLKVHATRSQQTSEVRKV